MDKILKELYNNLLTEFEKIKDKETDKLYRTNNSLFLTLSESGIKWQKKKYEQFRKKLFPCNTNDKLDIEMEIIYGHAWGRELSPSQNEHVIDASNIMIRKINS